MIRHLFIILVISLVGAQVTYPIKEEYNFRIIEEDHNFWHGLEWEFFTAFSGNKVITYKERNIIFSFKDAWMRYLKYRFIEPYTWENSQPWNNMNNENINSTIRCAKKREMAEIDFWKTKQLTPLIVRIWLIDADEPMWSGIKDCICSVNPFGAIMTYVRDKTEIMKRPSIHFQLKDYDGDFIRVNIQSDMKRWGVAFTDEETFFLNKLDNIIQNELLKILNHFKCGDPKESILIFLPDAYRKWNAYRNHLVRFYKSIGFSDNIVKLRLVTLMLARLYFYINFGQYFMNKYKKEGNHYLPPVEYLDYFDPDNYSSVRPENISKPEPSCFPQE